MYLQIWSVALWNSFKACLHGKGGLQALLSYLDAVNGGCAND